MSTLADLRYWGFFFLGLISLLLMMSAAAMWWRARDLRHSGQRLQGMGQSLPSPIATTSDRWTAARWLTAPTQWQHLLERLPGMTAYERWLQQSGWPLNAWQVLAGSLSLALAVVLLAWLLGLPWPLPWLAAVGAVLGIQLALAWRRQHRAQQLERQLPDALSLVARSMQAGHAFSSALQIAAQESPSPMGDELRRVFHEIQYGESPNEALSHWAARVTGQDIRIFVIAVRIQSETGGNLAELLQQTATLIRERQKLRGVVRVLSAEGRISAVVLTVLPFGLAAMLTTLNPVFMAQLWTDPLGLRLLTTALVLMGVGMLWMWRLVRVQP